MANPRKKFPIFTTSAALLIGIAFLVLAMLIVFSNWSGPDEFGQTTPPDSNRSAWEVISGAVLILLAAGVLLARRVLWPKKPR